MIATLNEWGAAWAAWFGPLVLQNTVFLGLVFLALHALRDASARVCAAVATVGVVKLALPPLLAVGGTAADAAAPAAGAVSALLFPFGEGLAGAAVGPAWSGGLSAAAVLLLAWVSLAAARLGWVGLQTLQLALAVRGAVPVDPAELPADVRRAGLAVRRSARIPLPLSFGPWPRTVYVPAAWDRWDRPARHAVLRHELAHVQRRDGLVLSVEILVQAAWFFHPLVGLLIRRLRTWREMACDDRCLAADPGARLAYTRFLAALAESALVRPVVSESASTLLRGPSELRSRVTHQLREAVMKPVPRIRIALVAALLAAAVLPLSLVQAEPSVPPPAPPVNAAVAPAPAPPAGGETQVRPADPAAKPAPAPRPDVPPPPPPTVNVVVRADGVTVNGEPVGVGELGDRVAKHAQAKGKGAVVAIDADGGVPMGKLHAVQDELRKAGLHKVVYRGELQQKVPLVLPPAKAKQALEKLPAQDVAHVRVDGAGVLTVDGKQVAGARLPALTGKRLEQRPETVFVLHTAGDTPYGAFVQVLAALQEGGAERIAVDDPQG